MKVATILFLIQGDQILLARKKRGFGKGYLNGYGGKQEPEDTTIEDALEREVLEEGGVKISRDPKKLTKVGIVDFLEGDEHLFECHVYFCYEWEDEPVETEEMEKPEAYPLSAPPFEHMWHADRTWMPLICAGKKIRGRSIYRKGMDVQERFEWQPL